jgi:hypothetical protein
MTTQTFSANAVARDASKVAGRTVTDKQVRGLARSVIARFDKTKHPAYQSHAYTANERKALLAVFTARAKGRPAVTGTKRTSKPRAKVAPVTASGAS